MEPGKKDELLMSRAEEFMTNWTSATFRERCVAQIESVRSVTNPHLDTEDQVEKFLAQNDSKQLEEFIFSKSKSKEDYMSLLAEMMMMLRQHAGKPVVDTTVLETASPEVLEAAGITANGLANLKKGEASGM